MRPDHRLPITDHYNDSTKPRLFYLSYHTPKKRGYKNLTVKKAYAIVTCNYRLAMKRRVRRESFSRELLKVRGSIEVSAEDGLRARPAES